MKYKKSEISSAHIVQAAMRVLARQGYARTSLMDIAKEAGMSKGAVHYHFPTKEALMGVVLQSACEAVTKRTLDAWQEGDHPLEALRASLHELWDVRATRTDEATVVADLLAQSLHDEKLRPPLAEYYRFAVNQVREHLTQQLAEGGMQTRIPPETMARLLHALLDGLLMQFIVDPEALDVDRVLDSLQVLALSLIEFGGDEAG